MAQSLIACPLCSAASFSSTNSLCLSLVNVTCKWIRCTMCEEELRGLDKFTIHLLGHLLHTPDFQRHMSTESFTTEPKGTKLSEPLNLVKDQNAPERINSSPGHFQFQNKSVFENINERPSLKIDDEVMIFFNSTDKIIEAQNKKQEMPQKCLETCAIELPKITINVNKIMDREDESNLGLNNEIEQPLPINCYDICTKSNECFVPTNPIDPLKNNISLSEVNSQLGNEKQYTHKKTKIGNTISKTKSMDCSADNSNTNLENYLDNQSGNKSSYLSPRGERVMGYRCDICSLVFPDEHILLMHRQLIHVELGQDPSKTKNYKCHLCSKSFVMKGSLMVHMRVAHFGGAVVARLVEAKQLETNAVSPESAHYICSVCNKGFRKEQQLIQHEKLHDGKQCNVCFKTFTTKYFLRKHMRLHTGEMPYSCKTCNKSFTFQQSYHKHLLYHNDDKPYTCTDCGRAFKELSTLHNHQRIHTGEKPFSCETCGKCFRQRVSYLVHRRIHTGVMPYRCQDCGKTFRYKVSERTHKCILSTPGGSNENSDQTSNASDVMNKEVASSPFSTTLGQEQSGQKEWNEKHPLDGNKQPFALVADHTSSSAEEINSVFPEPPDFFSLVMSPSERLQQLSLSTSDDAIPRRGFSTDSIDTEALKQLLYDVDDYT